MEKEYDVLVKDSEKKMKIRPEEIVIGDQTIFLKELITYSVNKKEGMIILEYGNENNSEMIIINLKDLKGKKGKTNPLTILSRRHLQANRQKRQ